MRIAVAQRSMHDATLHQARRHTPSQTQHTHTYMSCARAGVPTRMRQPVRCALRVGARSDGWRWPVFRCASVVRGGSLSCIAGPTNGGERNNVALRKYSHSRGSEAHAFKYNVASATLIVYSHHTWWLGMVSV